MIKIIYFDFGGVLINYQKVFTKICADFALDVKDFWNLYDQFATNLDSGKMTTKEFWQNCIQKYNLQNAENYDFVGKWVADYEIIQPINDLIYSLENKVEVGIISNICEGLWETSFKLAFVPDIKYKRIYLSYQEKMIKPNLNIYEKVQKESGVLPNEILFVDDRAENLIIPQNLGWQTVLFAQLQAEDGISSIKKMLSLN